MTEHEEIWLQPWCEACAMHEDRLWCQDNVWEDGCEECGAKPVKYALALSSEHRGAAPQSVAVENQADGNVGRSPTVSSKDYRNP